MSLEFILQVEACCQEENLTYPRSCERIYSSQRVARDYGTHCVRRIVRYTARPCVVGQPAVPHASTTMVFRPHFLPPFLHVFTLRGTTMYERLVVAVDNLFLYSSVC